MCLENPILSHTGVPGDDVIVAPSVKEEEAKQLFPKYKALKPYLRMTPLPGEVVE